MVLVRPAYRFGLQLATAAWPSATARCPSRSGPSWPRRRVQKSSRELHVRAAVMAELHGDTFFLDDFAIRQWDDPNYSGTRISFDKAEFVKRVHECYRESSSTLIDGYAPFCKHVIVPNFVGAKVGCLPITPENKHLLRCAYTRRRPDELAVLTRWFPASQVEEPEAKMLDVILYSREQIGEERKAMQASHVARCHHWLHSGCHT